MTTLVAKLREVDNIPYFVNADKNQEFKNLLDQARRDYPLIDKAAQREISFYDVIERLHERYKGWRLFLPRFRDKVYDKKLEEIRLDELIQADAFRTDSSQVFANENPYLGPFLGWFYDKIANPVVLPLLMGGFLALISGGQGRFESELANYSAYFGVGAFTGLFVGLIASIIKYQQLSIPKIQAKYLTTKIQEVYRS